MDLVAIVTGAGRGIGAATAKRLARDGYAVGVLDLDTSAAEPTAAAIRDSGGRAVALAADVADPDQARTAVAQVAEQLGAPVVLVNNAGILRDNLLFKMSIDDWDAVMSVHLRGAFIMTKECQAYMVQAGFGRIVNLSSSSALGNRGQANYAAAKAGIQGFTKTVAIELGKFGVTANAVAPGFIETDMTRATAARLNMSFDEFVDSVTAQIPVGRIGQVDDIAATISFLCSSEAGFVSGQTIYVAGGPLD